LNGTSFSTLKSAGHHDPKRVEKYNNTEVKYGAIFYGCHKTRDTAAVVYKYISIGSYTVI
jgi:hypothetical protein